MSNVTQILTQMEQGELTAGDQLLPLACEELWKLAFSKLTSERSPQTLQATALVHEALLSKDIGKNADFTLGKYGHTHFAVGINVP